MYVVVVIDVNIIFVNMQGVWFAEYDEICNDDDMVIDIDNNADLPSSETAPQLNHMYDKANGDLENDLDAVSDVKRLSGSVVALRRQSSVGSTASGPVNGIKTREHNRILQRMAVVEVKKPGKGSVFSWFKNMSTIF